MNTITVSDSVGEIVSRKPFLEEALASGLINLSSLARDIHAEVVERMDKEVKHGAIVMSLKRLKPDVNYQINERIKKVVDLMGDITVRSNLADFTYRNSDTLTSNQMRLLAIISKRKEIFYTLSQGIYETTIILSNIIEDEVNEIFKDEYLTFRIDNLSSITIKLPEENTSVFGVYYHILKKLAYEGINILEIVSTTHEFTIIVNDHDVDAAFSVLKRLKHDNI
ncbi:MAG: aspartate kinase [Bacteroidales bacterium]|nr:aspartate kinase [Bacteroidales bacterium]